MVETRRLQKTLRDLHGVDSSHLRSERVVLTYRDETMWEGVVEVFSLKGHPKAGLGYAWSQETDGGGRRYVAILGMPPIKSAADAVQVFLVAERP